MKKNLFTFALPIAIGAIGGAIILTTAGAGANAKAIGLVDSVQASPTVQRLQNESTEDSNKLKSGKISADVASAREATRIKAIKELYQTGALRGGVEFKIASEILEKSEEPKTVLLAHDIAVLSASLGAPDGLRQAARTEEKFLRLQGWGSRFEQSPTVGEPASSDVAGWHRRAVGMDMSRAAGASFSGPIVPTTG